MADQHPTPTDPMSTKRVTAPPVSTKRIPAKSGHLKSPPPRQTPGPATGHAAVPVRRGPADAAPAPTFVLQPMIHVTDMAASVAFYEQLGGSVIHGGRDADWVLMQLGTAQIGLLARPPRHADGESTVELNFLCTVPLDRLAKQLHGSGAADAKLVTDRTFGHQLHVQSPDGLLIRINEIDPDPLV